MVRRAEMRVMLANLTRVRVGDGILGDLVWAGDLAN